MSHPRVTHPSVKLNVLALEDRTTPTIALPTDPSKYVANEILFSIAAGADRNQTLTALSSSPYGLTAQELGFGVFRLTLKPGVTVRQALDGLEGSGWLGFVAPNEIWEKRATPNDTQFGDQWGMNNTGQLGGTPDSDIDAPEGWDIARGTGQTIVAIVDDGLDLQHPDIVANLWTNTGEIAGNNQDDDNNGFVDDVHGYDFDNDDGDPSPAGPTDDHGTHVAGIVGAVGNNGEGVAGVAWKTRIMALKFGNTGDAVLAIGYAVANGAKIINNSWGFTGAQNPGLTAAMAGTNAAGVIVVSAVNNINLNQDAIQDWPANYTGLFDNAVAVTATNRFNQKASFAAYGPTLTTIAAPGEDIWSLLPGGGYVENSGTSMATPHVAGALAVVWDAYPSLTYGEVIQLMKDTVDPMPDLQGQILTGGRLNLAKMLSAVKFGGYVVGADAGGGPNVKVFSTGGNQRASFFAYDAKFTGGVRVAYQDVNGDGVPDIITVPGGGGGPNVKVFDGKTQQELYSFFAYDPKFTNGLYVAAGDVDGDGVAEIVTGAGETGGPNVRVFKLLGNRRVGLAASYYAYAAGFTGGVRVAVGDVTGDGVNEILTTPGFGGGPHVRAFTAASVLAGAPVAVKDFMAGDPNAGYGAYLSVGNLNNDGIADLVVGSGAQNREVRAYDGKTLVFIGGFNVFAPGASATRVTETAPTVGALIDPNASAPTQLVGGNSSASAASAPTKPYAGLRVAMIDLNDDGIDDIVATGGPGDKSVVYLRNGQTMTTIGNDSPAFGNVFAGGAFVAAS